MTHSPTENPDRQFDHRKHIKSFLDTSRKVALLLPDGTPMEGITGIAGAAAITMISNEEIGVDYITLEPERNFPMHTHPGDHLLVFMEGTAIVEIGG